jgi:hypothetical protein
MFEDEWPSYKDYDVVIRVKEITRTPVASVDVKSFNIFIVTNSAANLGNKRQEIHMRGYNPTAKADTDLFGRNNDNSKNGALYSSHDNPVWAIVVPSEFRWAREAKNITTAYDGFAGRVTSGGANNQGWWENPLGRVDGIQTLRGCLKIQFHNLLNIRHICARYIIFSECRV